MSLSCHVLIIIPEEDLYAGAALTAIFRPFVMHLTSTVMKLIYFNTIDMYERSSMYVIFLQCTHCVTRIVFKKTTRGAERYYNMK